VSCLDLKDTKGSSLNVERGNRCYLWVGDLAWICPAGSALVRHCCEKFVSKNVSNFKIAGRKIGKVNC